VLAPVVIEIAAGLLLEQMEEEPAVQVAWSHDALDRLEVLA
jgi:hypothetical protein